MREQKQRARSARARLLSMFSESMLGPSRRQVYMVDRLSEILQGWTVASDKAMRKSRFRPNSRPDGSYHSLGGCAPPPRPPARGAQGGGRRKGGLCAAP